MFVGYLDPHHNKDLGVEIDGENWLNTGDLGRQDSDGYFWLAGRREELVIRGGPNIDPKLIEEALLKHPSVAMVAAIGSPDAYAGEVPVAYVQTKPGVSTPPRPTSRLDGSNPDQRRSKIAGKKSAQKLIGPSNAMRALAGTGAIFDRLTDRKVPAILHCPARINNYLD